MGALLAGGLARRMGGGDKPLRAIGGLSLMERVIARLAGQCSALLVNANGDPARFAAFGLPVAADTVEGLPGPLAGILAALEWVQVHRPGIEWVLSVPTDAPFLPRDLLARLHEAREEASAPAACARSGGRIHPVVGLWPVHLAGPLRGALVDEGLRRAEDWAARAGAVAVDWPAEPYDPFLNANRPEDLAAAEAVLARHPSA